MALFTWRGGNDAKVRGHTVLSIFPADTKYFGEDGASFMINYRVKDLDSVVTGFRADGVDLAGKIEESEYGRFAWSTDPEGNRIELWEPQRVNSAPKRAIEME